MSFQRDWDFPFRQLGESAHDGAQDDVEQHPEHGQRNECLSWGLHFRSQDVNALYELEIAARRVKRYIPDMHLSPNQTNSNAFPTTTVVSAFFPPPPDEVIQRKKAQGSITRSGVGDDYLRGLLCMVKSVEKLILFLPSEYAVRIRPFIKSNCVVIYEHYQEVWKIPNLRGRKDEFYLRQLSLAWPGGSRDGPYGHPHAWAAWNAKAFLMLEAIFLNPFTTSHFAWLDVKTPLAAEVYPKLENSLHTWPSPAAVKALYDAGAHPDCAVVTALEHGLRSIETPYWPRDLLTGESVDARLEDIWSLNANIMIGSRYAMARLSRAQLIFMERDLARGVFIGREEFQLSYLHFDFDPIISVLEVFRRLPFADEKMQAKWFAYCQLAKEKGACWTGMGLDKDEQGDYHLGYQQLESEAMTLD